MDARSITVLCVEASVGIDVSGVTGQWFPACCGYKDENVLDSERERKVVVIVIELVVVVMDAEQGLCRQSTWGRRLRGELEGGQQRDDHPNLSPNPLLGLFCPLESPKLPGYPLRTTLIRRTAWLCN